MNEMKVWMIQAHDNLHIFFFFFGNYALILLKEKSSYVHQKSGILLERRPTKSKNLLTAAQLPAASHISKILDGRFHLIAISLF